MYTNSPNVTFTHHAYKKKVVRTNFNNFLMDMVFFSGLNEFYIVQIPSEKDICRVVERSSPVPGNIL